MTEPASSPVPAAGERPEGPEVAERLAAARLFNPDVTEYEIGWRAGWEKGRAVAATERRADAEALRNRIESEALWRFHNGDPLGEVPGWVLSAVTDFDPSNPGAWTAVPVVAVPAAGEREPVRAWIEAESNAMTDNPQTPYRPPVVHPEPGDRPEDRRRRERLTARGLHRDHLAFVEAEVAAAVAAVRADLAAQIEARRKPISGPVGESVQAYRNNGLNIAAALVRGPAAAVGVSDKEAGNE